MTQVADGVFVRGIVDAECYVYNAGTLSWVAMTQPSGGGGGGDASAANQVLGNASLSSIDTKLTNPLPVSGTFYQVTQPVSLASMPSTPVTGTFYQVTQPVSIASMPSTPVTGTFFQVTQPVSVASVPLPANAAQETGGMLATIDTDLKSTQPRSITNFPAMQAVSEAAGTNIDLAALLALHQRQVVDLFKEMTQELRINNYLLQIGLSIKDDPDTLRADPSFSSQSVS